jgi:mitogen-activated protein kinase 15
VKVCDFGLCRSVAEVAGPAPVLTDYVATRWYRAPEILLGSTKYTRGVDMWAVGAILGEMLNGKPIFPGTSTMNQIERIVELTDKPSAEDLEAIQSPYASTMLDSLPPLKIKALNEVFPLASAEAKDLIKTCFFFNPDSRSSAEECLRHIYVTEFHSEEDEPVYPHGPLKLPIDDNIKLTHNQYRERLYQEITNRRRDSRKQELQRQKNQNATGQPV